MRTAIVSLASHGDRSFLDDNLLAHLSGRLRRRGHDNDLIVVALDGAAEEPERSAPFARLIETLRGYDAVVYERTWTRRIPAAIAAALPEARVIHLRGEHRLDDPPGRFVCDDAGALGALLDYLEGRRAALPARCAERTATGLRPGLGAIEADDDAAFAPNLRPIVINPEALPAERVVSIDGNPGCPYQADARDNPLYDGAAIPAGVGRGCAFCTTGNHYQARPDVGAWVFEQLGYVRANAPEVTTIVLRDQNPFGYLTEVLERCAAEGVGGFTLLLQTRADWLLQGRRRFGLALDAAARASIKVSPFLVGIESFSQPELDRFNKGVTVDTNRALIAAVRELDAHPAFDLSAASFGFILFTPWTTMEDLRRNLEGIRATRLDQLRGRLLHSRVRLYPDTALYYLAERDGLLLPAAPSAAAARYGYYPDRAWRFRDPEVAHVAAVAAAASDATAGRDELRLFTLLLEGHYPGSQHPEINEVLEQNVQTAVARVLERFHAPPPARSAARPTSPRRPSSRNVVVDLGHGCELGCPLCPSGEARQDLRGGGARVLLRGARPDRIEGFVAEARAAGFGEVVLATHATWLTEPEEAARLGVDAVLVPLFSHASAVHDRIVGREGSLVATLVAMRSLAAAGVAIEIEVPVLATRLQDLSAITELAHRAVPGLRAVRFGLPRQPVPAALAPPPLAELGERLDTAIAHAVELGLEAPLEVTAGVPMCAVVGRAHAETALRFDPRKRTTVGYCDRLEACGRCAVEAQCAGVPTSYARAHGARGLRPLSEKPRALYEQRTTARRQWGEDERAAASAAGLLVLRPTVHCNQDCSFCSANESTPNVWADPGKMKRAIARAARRGVERVSFSGGEPTLARELPVYIDIARRTGVAKVELVTNGVLLDREPRVAALVEAGLTHAFVSLHGHDEVVSSAVTRKRGDFDRTIAAIGHLERAGVITVINHVISAANYRFLTEFVDVVHARFGGRVMISFAFVTPQFKALENIELVPRLSTVMPHLLAAAWRALELGQPFVVGSRQGVPPCFLGPFEAWSDLMQLAYEARSEDSPQKQQGPQCGACRYASYCTGLWRPYVARFGTDELVAVPGTPIDEEARAAFLAHARRPPWGQPMRFEEAPADWRRPALEAAGPPVITGEPAAPVPVAAGTRPLRILMVGSGRRARELGRALRHAGGLAVTGVCSPHADIADRAAFDGAPAFVELGDALEETRPDAVIVASATEAHAAAVEHVLARGVPLLVEKPLATGEAEAARLAALGGFLMPAHNDLFAAGLTEWLASVAGQPLAITRQHRRGAPDVPLRWSRPALYESLYHLVVVALRHLGDESPRIGAVHLRGEQCLERLRVELVTDVAAVTLSWEAERTGDFLGLSAGARSWRRVGREVEVDGVGAERSGGELVAMLAAFGAAVRGSAPAPIGAHDGVAAMRATRLLLDAMAEAGAPFVRPSSPRHAASRELSRRYPGSG